MGIPSVTIAATLHLTFISLLLGLVLTEIILELLPVFQKDLKNSTIRFHFWIDFILELPLGICVGISGIILAFLVPKLTVLHIVKISFASLALLLGIVCIYRVVKRNRLLKINAGESDIAAEDFRLHATAGAIYILFALVIILGVYLSYNRVLSFYR